MMTSQRISLPVIKRLPKYYRYVAKMKATGVTTVSSSGLAAIMGTTASQVRQDFNCFGGFGQQGIGYSIDVLAAELEKLLFSEHELNTILIGTGKLGRAVSRFLASEARGYKLVAAFDTAQEQVGKKLEHLTVQNIAGLQEYCKQNKPKVAVLCVPEEGAALLAPTLKELGVKGFWNFSHFDIATNQPDVVVENVHLGDSLTSLGYRVRNNK